MAELSNQLGGGRVVPDFVFVNHYTAAVEHGRPQGSIRGGKAVWGPERN